MPYLKPRHRRLMRVSALTNALGLAALLAATGVVAVAIPSTATGLPDGVVLALGFDEGSGTSAADASGAGNDATVHGAAWGPGRYGNGLTFDGLDDWVTVPDADSLDLREGFTLSAWVRPDAGAAQWRPVMAKETTDSIVYAMYASSPGTSQPHGMVNVTGTYPSVSGGPALPTGQWTHLATTWDGSSMRIYVNGQLRNTHAFTDTLPASDQPLRIGGNAIWDYEFYDGALDEVRVYNRALGPTDIVSDRDTPAPTPTPPADAAITDPPPTAPPGAAVEAASSQVLSIGQPVYASSGDARSGTDSDLGTAWSPRGQRGWLAIDLSATEPTARADAVLTWEAKGADGYSVKPRQGVCPVWPERAFPHHYRIEASSASGGTTPPETGWDVLTTVTGNDRLARQHRLALSDYNWVRMVAEGVNGIAINVDLTAATRGQTDAWLFLGDSITARYAGPDPVNAADVGPVHSFTDLVDDQTSGRSRPTSVNAGMSCAKAADAVVWIDAVLDEFAGRYVTLGFGTNDGWAGVGDPDDYYRNMQSLVDSVLDGGKIPVVATVPWPNSTGPWAGLTQRMNDQIERLYQANPEVLRGPDLYTLTEGRHELFAAVGDPHPNSTGIALIREAWAEIASGRLMAVS